MADAQVPGGDLDHRGRQVGDQPHPAHAGRGTATGGLQSELVLEEQVREVDPRARAEAVVAPGAGIEIEQLEFLIARVLLVLELDQSVVADLLQVARRP